MENYNHEGKVDITNKFVFTMFERNFKMTEEEKEMLARILNVPMNGNGLVTPLKHNSILQFYLLKHLEKNSKSNDRNSARMIVLTVVLAIWGLVEILLKLYELNIIDLPIK